MVLLVYLVYAMNASHVRAFFGVPTEPLNATLDLAQPVTASLMLLVAIFRFVM